MSCEYMLSSFLVGMLCHLTKVLPHHDFLEDFVTCNILSINQLTLLHVMFCSGGYAM